MLKLFYQVPRDWKANQVRFKERAGGTRKAQAGIIKPVIPENRAAAADGSGKAGGAVCPPGREASETAAQNNKPAGGWEETTRRWWR
ncbi:MAG: hypothetical protein AB1767_08800 [Bacillota bacterium]